MNPKHKQQIEDAEPFKNLKISDWKVLEDIENRSLCSNCNKSRKYFCYSCYIPVTALQGLIPRVKLPVKIDIIKHAREIDGKSTAAHVAVLAPDDVRVYTYPSIPNFEDTEKVVLVYPGKCATSVKSLVEHFRSQESGRDTNPPVSRAVFIDSTWNQSRGIYKDPRLRALPCVVLGSRVSQFWRHQKGSPRWYLATVEAVHQFCAELGDARYAGQCDDLLFFFCFMYAKIHSLYRHDDLHAYKRPLK
ncbi:tRNA-uridine aminocarboxypropyltransferase 1 isoform X2 [Bacillus rossius redtenbacheri]|uniref:tRNA-uridine aminocarboxypropyltransferase 1 isoform X2 n=1 Tax=Bacillus rossius redtenbacheri TaxID=93214 RepID=UPI002FDDCA5E